MDKKIFTILCWNCLPIWIYITVHAITLGGNIIGLSTFVIMISQSTCFSQSKCGLHLIRGHTLITSYDKICSEYFTKLLHWDYSLKYLQQNLIRPHEIMKIIFYLAIHFLQTFQTTDNLKSKLWPLIYWVTESWQKCSGMSLSLQSFGTSQPNLESCLRCIIRHIIMYEKAKFC